MALQVGFFRVAGLQVVFISLYPPALTYEILFVIAGARSEQQSAFSGAAGRLDFSDTAATGDAAPPGSSSQPEPHSSETESRPVRFGGADDGAAAAKPAASASRSSEVPKGGAGTRAAKKAAPEPFFYSNEVLRVVKGELCRSMELAIYT